MVGEREARWEASAGPGPDAVVVVAETPPSGGGLRRVGTALVVAVAALAVAASAWMALDAGGSEAGADGAEAAVLDLLDAVEAGDLVGVVELVEPTERDTLGRSTIEVVHELQRLGVLDPGLALDGIEGVGLSFGEVTTRIEPVTADIVDVVVSSPALSAHLVVDQPPFGPLVIDRVPPDVRGERLESEPGPGAETVVATVRRDGRWYVSALYTAAELARRAGGEPGPLPAGDLAARGAPDPDSAVRGFVEDAASFDPRRLLGRLAPDEAAVLYDYAGVYLPGLEEAAARILSGAREAGWTWTVDGLETNIAGDGDRALVSITAMALTVVGPDTRVVFVMDEGGSRLDWSATDPVTGTVEWSRVLIDDQGCVSAESSLDDAGAAGGFGMEDPALALAAPGFDRDGDGRVCRDEIPPVGVGVFGLFDPVRVVTAPQLVTRRVEGAWYVSPLRSVLEPALEVLRATDPDAVERWLDLFTGGAEFDEAAGSASGPAVVPLEPPVPSTTVLAGDGSAP